MTIETPVSRSAEFRERLSLDDETWARGRGWALWKALIIFTGLIKSHPRDIEDAQQVLADVLSDH